MPARCSNRGPGVDVVIEMAGNDAGIATGVNAARPGAGVVLGGIPDGDLSSFTAAAARRQGLSFVMVRRMHETYPVAIWLATSGVDLEPLVTAAYPLEEAAEAFSAAVQRTGQKVIIRVSSSTDSE